MYNGTLSILVYNLDTMQKNSPSEISKVARDPDFFVWFMTLVIGALYALTLYNEPTTREPGILFPLTVLTFAHLLLHWYLGKIMTRPSRLLWYILVQGVLALMISVFARNLGMTFALFMGLLGEAVGLFRLTRRGLLAGGYYLALLIIGIIQLFGWAESGPFLLTTIPMAIFVTLFVTLYMRQNEAREQAQALAAELETANRQLAAYAAQVEDLTLTAERQRMARELHDTLAQGVAGLVLQLEAVKAHLEAGRGERAADIIEHALGRARSTLADSRAAIDDLRSVPASLPEAVRAKVERFTQATGIPCSLDLALGDSHRIPAGLGDHALRVLNEALANVTRHAQATQVWVQLVNKDHKLELEIRDNGQGFDPDAATRSGHYGLLGMRERARLAGGTLTVESGNGKGTCIHLQIPFAPEGEIA